MSGRMLAPRPGPEQATVSTAGSSSSQDPRTGASQTENTVVSVRKKVTSACRGCQKRRVKCDGGLPCYSCRRGNVECSYLPELDGRSIKRKYYEVQDDQSLLHNLLDTIRHVDDEHIRHIIALIRSNASMAEVKACVAQKLVELQTTDRAQRTELQQLQNDLELLADAASDRERTARRAGVLGIHRLTDQPPYRVPAAPWTTVTDDDDLVSHLISVWLTWDKGWHDWVDENLFIRDMKAGSLDALFCSPFLVNSLLAWGCTYSDFPEARTVNGAVSPLTLAFIAEAKSLLDGLSPVGLCMTTIQGLMFLHGTVAVSGQDQYSYRYMLEAMELTRHLIASPLAARLPSDPQKARDISTSIDRTCWGVFIVTTQTVVAIHKPATMDPPRRPRPRRREASATSSIWSAYPYQESVMPSCCDELFDLGCDLAIVEAELSRLLFDMAQQPPRRQLERRVMQLFGRLEETANRRAAQIEAVKGSCPAVFAHRARVQFVILRMFVGLRESVADATPGMVYMARCRCLEAALEVAETCRLHMESWGSYTVGIMLSQPLLFALMILLGEPDNTLYDRQITDICVALRAQSRRWPIVMGMFRMTQLDARRNGWRLPPEASRLFEEFEETSWKRRELRRYATLYPVAVSNMSVNLTGEESDMGHFLEIMEGLEVHDSPSDLGGAR